MKHWAMRIAQPVLRSREERPQGTVAHASRLVLCDMASLPAENFTGQHITQSTSCESNPCSSDALSEEASARAVKAPRALRILLVEDDVVSQEVIVRFMQRLGYSVEIAATGPVALAKLREQSFDVALMDVQLPGMNGFDVTMHLRSYERTHGGHLPIIAVTARAFPEDKERCRAAGMDAYVSKPIQATMLYAALREAVGEEPIAPHQQPAMNVAIILQSVGGDRALLRELGRLFLVHVPRQFDALQEAFSQEKPAAVERAAHALRGSMAMFHAQEACRLLETLLLMGRAEQLQGEATMPIIQALREEVDILLAFLRTPGWDTPAL